MIPADMTPGSPSWNYERLSWQEKSERIPNDFGEPTKTNPEDWQKFTDWERSKEHLSANYF